MLFVKRYLPAQLLKLGARHVFELKLIAEYAEGRDVKARRQGRIAQGLLMRGGGDVRAHRRLRVEIRKSALDIQPLNGVGVVRGPDLRRIAQHAEVEAVTA